MLLDFLLKKMGYIRTSYINDKLNFARNVAKRLDEHRETVEAIQSKTTLFNDFWHVDHMAIQDDYLMRLFHMVHGCWPESQSNGATLIHHVRARPKILGSCKLPEYRDGKYKS